MFGRRPLLHGALAVVIGAGLGISIAHFGATPDFTHNNTSAEEA